MITVYIHEDFKTTHSATPGFFSQCDEIEVDTVEEAFVLLHAYAAKSNPEYAAFFKPVGGQLSPEPIENHTFRSGHCFGITPIAFPADIRDEATAEAQRLENDEIEGIVTEALNAVYSDLAKNGLSGQFVSTVSQAAKEWAQDCYQ